MSFSVSRAYHAEVSMNIIRERGRELRPTARRCGPVLGGRPGVSARGRSARSGQLHPPARGGESLRGRPPEWADAPTAPSDGGARIRAREDASERLSWRIIMFHVYKNPMAIRWDIGRATGDGFTGPRESARNYGHFCLNSGFVTCPKSRHLAAIRPRMKIGR